MIRLLAATLLALSLAVPARAAEIAVYAAASLTDVFGAIKADFEKSHPGRTVALTTAASGDLLQRLRAGQTADVLATADLDTMDAAADSGIVRPASRSNFAGNALVMAVPAGNPAGVTDLDALSLGGVRRIGVGNPESVPAGRYAKRALGKQALWYALTSKLIYFPSVRHVLTALCERKIDAGFVYRTDAYLVRRQVDIVLTLPLSPPVTYVAALTAKAPHPGEAAAFLAYLSTPEARARLAAFGFTVP